MILQTNLLMFIYHFCLIFFLLMFSGRLFFSTFRRAGISWWLPNWWLEPKEKWWYCTHCQGCSRSAQSSTPIQERLTLDKQSAVCTSEWLFWRWFWGNVKGFSIFNKISEYFIINILFWRSSLIIYLPPHQSVFYFD